MWFTLRVGLLLCLQDELQPDSLRLFFLGLQSSLYRTGNERDGLVG